MAAFESCGFKGGRPGGAFEFTDDRTNDRGSARDSDATLTTLAPMWRG